MGEPSLLGQQARDRDSPMVPHPASHRLTPPRSRPAAKNAAAWRDSGGARNLALEDSYMSEMRVAVAAAAGALAVAVVLM